MYICTHLRCEYLNEPLCVDEMHPRLSWEGQADHPGGLQIAYQIQCSLNKEFKKDSLLWDTGKVTSNQSFQIPYEGSTLTSYQQVFWRVRGWNQDDHQGGWSRTASWTMGILKKEEWQARYIKNYLSSRRNSPLFRKEFILKKKLKRALIHVTALGLYDLHVNGESIQDDVFAPGWTDYNQRRLYRAYNITKNLLKGQNVIAAELADGWCRGNLGWSGTRGVYHCDLSFLAQIRLEYQDGTIETILTDESWKTIFGHTTSADFYDGEHVDSQLEPKGWAKAGFDDTNWEQASLSLEALKNPQDQEVTLQAYPAEPIRQTEELKPISYWEVAKNKVIYDFGQNFAGRVRIHFKGKAGQVLIMRFGEMVNKDQTLYTENLRNAMSTDSYVMRGDKIETWEPKFTFHGFRYLELTGCPVKPSLKNVTGVVIGSDTTRVGYFESSDKIINKIYENAVWTQRANFLEVPTDCPQRDERLGWTGDAQVFIRTAICNMDTAAFFKKWLADLNEAQSPKGAYPKVAPDIIEAPNGQDANGDAAWGDAGVVCPWTLYTCYEDKKNLEKYYPNMMQWIDFLASTSKGYLRGPDHTFCFGDWLSINADTPKDVIQTAHYAYNVDIVRKIAEVLGKKADATKLKRRFTNIKNAFQKAYVQRNGKIKGDTQTGYLMALKFNLLNQNQQQQAIKHLVKNIEDLDTHLSTGFIGTALIMSVLREAGHVETAYKLLENKTFPSWGYSVVNGATSIWERWNGWTIEGGPGDVHMNSYSHYAYGAVVEWMFDTIAGIDHGTCGFQNFKLQPIPGGKLTFAKASYHSPYGLIKSSWKKKKDKIIYKFWVPTNTQAKLKIQGNQTVKLNGEEITLTENYKLEPGKYKIEQRINENHSLF
ncbi:MAG: glycoside hydrolase family 78 protein [Lentisphaeria bacterium]|nr:glycoside hydrolase family 78 protein [Lentisphaeria bacterium]